MNVWIAGCVNIVLVSISPCLMDARRLSGPAALVHRLVNLHIPKTPERNPG